MDEGRTDMRSEYRNFRGIKQAGVNSRSGYRGALGQAGNYGLSNLRDFRNGQARESENGGTRAPGVEPRRRCRLVINVNIIERSKPLEIIARLAPCGQ